MDATTTTVDVEIDRRVIEAVDSAIPCNIRQVATRARKCPEPARWIFIWRGLCAHGGDVQIPVPGLLCNEHAEWMRAGGWGCPACLCLVKDYKHLVERIERL